MGALPVDSESRFALVEHVRVRDLKEPHLVLNEEQWATINEFSLSKETVCKLNLSFGTNMTSEFELNARKFMSSYTIESGIEQVTFTTVDASITHQLT
jgi:hypothetical protein